MDIFFENPLARMYGPSFVFLYILLFVAAFLYVRYALADKISSSKKEDDINIPDQPDPYEVASIWQTENEVLALVIYNLVRRGYLSTEQKSTTISIKSHGKDVAMLNELEHAVYKRLEKPGSLSQFVKDV